MKKYLAELLFLPGFIFFEYGLYLVDIKAALMVGGVIFMGLGVKLATNADID